MLITDLFEDPDIMAVVRLGDVTVEVHRHLADQQRERGVSDRRVEDVLRQIHMVPRRQMMALPHGQRFWVYDPKNDTALGYTMISPERRVLRLKTTVPNRPWDSDRPIFDLPGQRPLQEVSGFGELDVSKQLQRYFIKRGYRIASEGRDQMVFHRPGQRHVIKVIGQSDLGTERGDVIADYVRFFAANQANPHFPRVSQPREIDVEEEIYTIYRQELLQDLSDDEEERLLDWIQAFGQALGDPMGPGMVKAWLQNNPPPRSLPLRQVQGVYAAVTKLLQHYGDDLGGEMRLDLGHAANFMQRADGTIVVVDPIAYDEEYGTYSESTYISGNTDMIIDDLVPEARLHREEDLFKTGGFLSNRRIDTDLLRLRPLDNRFALWHDQHLQQIAHEQEYIGEEFPDWTTSGIVDRQIGEPVAVIMYTDGWSSPFPDSVEISQVEVNPQYRGQGLARYLYSLLRREHNIVSDQDQSPGGAAMWVRMAREGIPVQGWVRFGSNRTPAELDASYDGEYDYEGQLKKLGARQVAGQGRSPLYVFPVREQNGRLDNLAGTTIRVYQGDYINHWESGLVAPKG